MLKRILSISGKSGLYELISQGKNMLIVESLKEKKRIPAYSHEKIISLADIAIFADEGEVPLKTVLSSIKKKENGAKATLDPKSDNKALREYFASILPDFDREKVYPTDIKKIISWYNLLIESGKDVFTEESEEKAAEQKTEEAKV
ncbi:MAG: DUF5606 domain-containing protein [Prevotellaceae bacterium]|jgi:hypothetical protein|nr:DUF5606 domain-containing protein [Prevotellaceae bacterium]